MFSFMHNMFGAKLPQKNNELKDDANKLRIQTPEEKVMLKAMNKNAGDNCFNGNIDDQLAAILKIEEIISSKTAIVTIYEAASVVSNLCQNGSPQVVQALKPLLKKLIQNSDPVVILLGLNAIFYAIKKSELISVVTDQTIVKQLVNLLKHNDKDVTMTAFVILAQIFEEDYMKIAISAGIIKHIPQFLASQKMQLKREATNIIYKIVSTGSQDDVYALIRVNAVPYLCSFLHCKDKNLIEKVLSILTEILQKSGKMSADICKTMKKNGCAETLTTFINNNQNLQIKSEKLYKAIYEKSKK